MKEGLLINKHDLYEEACWCKVNNLTTVYFIEMLTKMAKNILNMNQFKYLKHRYKEDSIQNALYKCLKIYHNYNIELINAFAYYTTVIINEYNSFLEKQIKHSNIIDIDISDIRFFTGDNYNGKN